MLELDVTRSKIPHGSPNHFDHEKFFSDVTSQLPLDVTASTSCCCSARHMLLPSDSHASQPSSLCTRVLPNSTHCVLAYVTDISYLPCIFTNVTWTDLLHSTPRHPLFLPQAHPYTTWRLLAVCDNQQRRGKRTIRCFCCIVTEIRRVNVGAKGVYKFVVGVVYHCAETDTFAKSISKNKPSAMTPLCRASCLLWSYHTSLPHASFSKYLTRHENWKANNFNKQPPRPRKKKAGGTVSFDPTLN